MSDSDDSDCSSMPPLKSSSSSSSGGRPQDESRDDEGGGNRRIQWLLEQLGQRAHSQMRGERQGGAAPLALMNVDQATLDASERVEKKKQAEREEKIYFSNRSAALSDTYREAQSLKAREEWRECLEICEGITKEECRIVSQPEKEYLARALRGECLLQIAKEEKNEDSAIEALALLESLEGLNSLSTNLKRRLPRLLQETRAFLNPPPVVETPAPLAELPVAEPPLIELEPPSAGPVGYPEPKVEARPKTQP